MTDTNNCEKQLIPLKYSESITDIDIYSHKYINDLVSIYSPSRSEFSMIDYVFDALIKLNFDVSIDKFGNIMAKRGEFTDKYPYTKYPILNAHMDTVQSEYDLLHRDFITYSKVMKIYHSHGMAMIGGDDKCGIGIILSICNLIPKDMPIKVLFTVQEESGSNGIANIPSKWYNDCSFCFTFDRKGNNDIISEYCDRKMCSSEFLQQLIDISSNCGFKMHNEHGSIADTYYISKHVTSVNISSGYYNPHTKNDYISMNDVNNIIFFALSCLNNITSLEKSAIGYNISDDFKKITKFEQQYDGFNSSLSKRNSQIFNEFDDEFDS